MKIVTGKCKDEIKLEDVTRNHIIVGKMDGNPVIMQATEFDGDFFRFFPLNRMFTMANSYKTTTTAGFINAILWATRPELHDGKNELHAFMDWKDAFQWLLDNC